MEGVNSLMFLRSKRVGFCGGILKNSKNRKLSAIFNAIKNRMNAFHNKGWIKTKSRGGSRIFFRRGCTRLLLYFNTNKPHSFFFLCRILVVLENRRPSQGGVRTPCTLPLDPPLKSHVAPPTMTVKGSSAYMGYIFHLFSLQVYQRERNHESSSLHALVPLFFLARKEMSAFMLSVEVNWSLCTATPSPQEKNRKRFLFPHFFLMEWGGYTVARKTASYFFFTIIIIKIDFKASCKWCPCQYYWSILFLKEVEYPRLLLL